MLQTLHIMFRFSNNTPFLIQILFKSVIIHIYHGALQYKITENK